MLPARLTFACELPPAKLAEIGDAEHRSLRAIGARVAMALPDLSTERAGAVRALNDAGVPVVAIPLLAPEDGVFLNLDNAPAALRRYHEVRAWSRANALKWDAVSLDLEPSADDLRVLFVESDPRAFMRRALPRIADADRLNRGTEEYRRLAELIRNDGLAVESYRFPFLLDDRRARSTIIHRLMGAPALRIAPETLMLYSSFAGRLAPALVGSYGRHADAIAVGSTGGGDPGDGPEVPVVGWEELRRDLLVARRCTTDITIHSLEGCIAQDLLPRLESFDWTSPAPPVPRSEAIGVAVMRTALCGVLAVGAHPVAMAAVAVVIAVRRTRRRATGRSLHGGF